MLNHEDEDDLQAGQGNPNEEKNTQIIYQRKREKNIRRQAPWW